MDFYKASEQVIGDKVAAGRKAEHGSTLQDTRGRKLRQLFGADEPRRILKRTAIVDLNALREQSVLLCLK